MAYTKYSLTPANNTAAPPDGAPEGMLPSAVNDTMRDMMAQIRDVGDGVRDGTYTMTAPKITGGTITGVTLTGNTLTNPTITGATLTTSALNGTVGATTASTGAFTTLSTSSTTTLSGLTASTALALDASKNVVSVTNTGTGNNVLSASPTLTGTIAGASLSLSSLTSGRVTYAGASGLLGDSANLQFDGTNLGLGVTPSAWGVGKAVQIGAAGDASLWGFLNSAYLSSNAYYNGVWIYTATAAATQYLQQSGQHIWYNAPSGTAASGITFTPRMTLDASGNLLLGTTNTVIWNTTNTGVVVGGVSAPAIQISRNADACLLLNRIGNDGDVAIFARQGAAVGGISVNTSSTSFNTSSDYRLKENIVPMTGALATVAQLKPVTYKWKVDGSNGQGFIAHELQAVVPDCVTGEKDAVDEDGKPKYQGVDTSFLVATLVSAIQELKAEVDSLKQQLNGA
jgi:hypothetical protein